MRLSQLVHTIAGLFRGFTHVTEFEQGNTARVYHQQGNQMYNIQDGGRKLEVYVFHLVDMMAEHIQRLGMCFRERQFKEAKINNLQRERQ